MAWPEIIPDDAHALAGVRLMIVEDDPLILMDVEAALGDAGAEIAGAFPSVAGALAFLAAAQIDAAVLDFGLGRETAAPVARALVARKTPFLFYTGQVETDPRLAEWRGRTILQKPAMPRQLVAAVARLKTSAAA